MAFKQAAAIGDTNADIPAAKDVLDGYSYGVALKGDRTPVYTSEFASALATYKSNVHYAVMKGTRPAPDVDPRDPTFDWATKKQMGLIKGPVIAPPKPLGPRHLGIVFRGTGGTGEDYVYRIMRSVADLVETVSPQFAATMGGIPVGTAGGIDDPSMDHAVQLAVADAQRITLEALRINPRRKIIVGGYSAGAVAAALYRQWLMANFPDNYLCSFSLGDPTRPAGGAYFGGTACPGRGISTFHYGDIRDYRHCWLAQPGDMYTSVPNNAVGDIMDTAYAMVTQVELSDFLGTAMSVAKQIPIIMDEAGISLPGILGALATGPVGILGLVTSLGLPMVLGMIGSATGGGMGSANPTGAAAAGQAIAIALKFIAAQPPTGPHITYEVGEVWPGQTYLGLGVQHVRDYASRTPALAA